MYQDSVCFDPSTSHEVPPENGFFQNLPNIATTTTSFSMEELSYQEEPVAAMEMELQQQYGIDMENYYANNHHRNLMDISHLMQEAVGHYSDQVLIHNYDHNFSWDMNNMKIIQEENLHINEMQNSYHLLNLLHPPKVSPSSVLPNSPFSFGFVGDHFPSSSGGGSASNDPLFHLSLPPQPPYFGDLFQFLPYAYDLLGSRTGSAFGGGKDRERSGGGEVVGRSFDNGVLEYQADWHMNGIAKVRNGRKNAKQFPTERDRREHLNGKFTALKGLIPNLTKPDRASILAEAIEYIKEQLRRVNELKFLVEMKQYGKDKIKRHKTYDGTISSNTPAGEVVEGSCTKIKLDNAHDHSYSNIGSSRLRLSWLQRKSQDTEVDVRIVDDEVTIKLAQRKRINCLLVVSKVLVELQLDIRHVAGGLVGDNCCFLFNCKIGEGSSVYASAIANKLIDVVNRHYGAKPPPTHPHQGWRNLS